uniref:Uncharacterized protein n=1 Tax=Panagrolaimus sp. JU765 TaxID=591449 RepID=A0AC34QL70_9BILA
MNPSNMSFDGYDDSWYGYGLTFTGTLAIIFGFLGMYFTLFCSPRQFGAFKYFLFNICLWSFVFDFYTAVLFRPVVLAPATVMCATGIISTSSYTLGHVYYITFVILFGICSVSVLSAFIYRYCALIGKLDLLLSKKCLVLLAAFHLLYDIIPAIMNWMESLDKDRIHELIFQQWPNIRSHIVGHGCACVHMSRTSTIIFSVVQIGEFFIGIPIATILVHKCFNSLNAQKSIMSTKTYQMHRNLLISLIFQWAVPVFVLFTPFGLTAIISFGGVENMHFLSMLGIVVGGFHSFCNTMMMIHLIPHYKHRFYYFIKKRILFRNVVMDISRTTNSVSYLTEKN